MARQTNGTSQDLSSAATLSALTAYSKISVQLWLWWDTFANDNKQAMELGNGATSGDFTIAPNDSAGGSSWGNYVFGNVGSAGVAFPRPTAAAWHHFVVNFDFAKVAHDEVNKMYIDTVDSFTGALTESDNASGTTFANATLYLMSRGSASNWGAGRIAEVAIWGGINLSSVEVASLYNSGNGALASDVQPSALKYYWQLLGTTSPEPANIGSIDMTVNGASSATHPFTVSSDTGGYHTTRVRARFRGF